MAKVLTNQNPNQMTHSKQAYSDCISIGCWNIQGLVTKHIDKTQDDALLNEIKGTDIVGLVETHVVDDQGGVRTVEGYETRYFNRPKHIRARNGSGGIVILNKPHLREGLKFFPSKNNDFVWIKLDKYYFNCEHDLYLCIAYVPPSNSSYTKRQEENILDRIETDTYKYKNMGDIILMGDLNGRVGTLPDYIENDNDKHLPLDEDYNIDIPHRVRSSQDNMTDDRGKHILEICIASQLRLLNGRKLGDSIGYYTSHQYNGSSVIDYAICSSNIIQDIPYFKVHPFIGTLSDHCMISCMIKAKPNIKPEPKINMNKIPSQYKWTETSKEGFKAALQLPPIQNLIMEANSIIASTTTIDTINTATQTLTMALKEAAKISLKSKHNTKKPRKLAKPWTTAQIKQLEREVIKKGHIMTKHQTGDSRRSFFLALKRLRKERKYTKRHFLQSKIDELNTIKNSNPRQFWQILQDLKEGNKENHADKIEPGQWYQYLVTQNKNKSNKEEDQAIKDAISALDNKSFNELDFQITELELNTAISKLKNNKSPGQDQILNEMIKNSDKHIHNCILKLFNRIFSEGILPDCWASGVITNIHKKGSYLDPANYRSITITSSLGKLLNSILAIRLNNHLEKHGIITPEQIGFTKNSRTSDHIFTLKTAITKYTNKTSQKLYACMVDFKQAFDRIWHMGLFYKLSKLNINNHFFRIIQNMYSKIQLSIKVQNQLTDPFWSTLGVRQGDNLSPILFNLYINDLPQHLNNLDGTDPITIGNSNINCLMYADDLILLSTSRSGLQKCINGIKEYSDKWKMEINLNKTKTLIFNKKGTFTPEKFYYGNEIIECVNNYTYLGIDLDSSGSFNNAVKKLYAKGLKALYKLYKLTDNNYNIQTILYIFDHTIAPILLYGSEVWGIDFVKLGKEPNNSDLYFEKHLDNNILTQLEIKFYKRLLHVKRHTSTSAVRGELGRHPITLKAIGRSLSYFNHLTHKPDTELVKQALNECLTLETKNIKNWYTTVKQTQHTLNIPHPPDRPSKYQLKQTDRKTEKSLQQGYEKLWHQEINTTKSRNKNKGGNKLRTYCKLKQNFAFENYLSVIDNTSHRAALTQLRLSSHPLNIEVLRGTVINPSERTCKICNLNQIEDEFHLVIECPEYNSLRDEVISKLSDFPQVMNLSNTNKAIWLLTNEEKTICKAMSKFIHDCYGLRREKLKQEANS